MHLGLDLLFLIPDRSGGRETYVRELLRALRPERADLHVTTFINRETAEAGRGFWDELADQVVRLSASSPSSRVRWGRAEYLGLPLSAARAGVDVLHSPANVGPLHGRLARVLTLHDLLFPRRATRRLVRAGVLRAHRVITGSAAMRDELAKTLRVPPDRFNVVHHGVSAPGAGRAVPVDDRLNSHGRPVALVVGADLEHKNLGAAVEALGELQPESRPVLVFAGLGTDGPRLRSLASEHGVLDDVRLLGLVDDAFLEDLYAAAAVLVSPSLGEGFGLTVLEAMARGVPVACADIPVLREVAGDAAVRFDPRQPGAIAEAIRRLIGGGSEAERLRDAGLERVRDLTWRTAAQRTLAVYDAALERVGTR